jgi:diguanylate cyclase (GGDEF)-like protein
MLAMALAVAAQSVMALTGGGDAALAVGLLAVPALAAALVWERVRRTRSERAAWSAVGIALVLLIGGNVYSIVAFADPADAPVPSPADVLYLAEYPLLFVALGLLVRARVVGFRPSMWIDGAVATLAIAALWTAAGLSAPEASATAAGAATINAYVILDAVLVSLAIGTLALFRWRAEVGWIVIVGGVTVQSVADLLATRLSAGGDSALVQSVALLWSLALVAIGLSAWLHPTRSRASAIAGWRAQAPPAVFSLVALGILMTSILGNVPITARILATGAVAAAMVRLLWTANENVSLEVARTQAVTDDLTGLGNRRLLTAAIAAACAKGGQIAVLLLDLDGFKEVNDALGHAAGDRLLREVGERLARIARPDDVLARIGGDEFGMLVHSAGEAAARTAADRMSGALERPFDLCGIRVRVAASTGIALTSSGREAPPELLRRADVAMYEAKRDRRRHCLYRPDDDERSPDSLVMIERLRHAIEERSLDVHYQPKAAVRTGAIYGIEALVRWRPDADLLPPAVFLPMAERAGLMYDLTMCVLERALADLAVARLHHPALTVGVNAPVVAILDATFARDVERLLASSGIPGTALDIEITEDGLMSDHDRARTLIADLRRLGVTVSIDDYGTGYSSLQYLHDLEVDSLKLDQAFVTGLAASETSRTIVASTIQLAHALGLHVVAEGVETCEDWETLDMLGCDAAQGFLLGRPAPLAGVVEAIGAAWDPGAEDESAMPEAA